MNLPNQLVENLSLTELELYLCRYDLYATTLDLKHFSAVAFTLFVLMLICIILGTLNIKITPKHGDKK